MILPQHWMFTGRGEKLESPQPQRSDLSRIRDRLGLCRARSRIIGGFHWNSRKCIHREEPQRLYTRRHGRRENLQVQIQRQEGALRLRGQCQRGVSCRRDQESDIQRTRKTELRKCQRGFDKAICISECGDRKHGFGNECRRLLQAGVAIHHQQQRDHMDLA